MVVDLVVLIYVINHIATTIQLRPAIAAIARDLSAAMDQRRATTMTRRILIRGGPWGEEALGPDLWRPDPLQRRTTSQHDHPEWPGQRLQGRRPGWGHGSGYGIRDGPGLVEGCSSCGVGVVLKDPQRGVW
jgi:hypothetical protein